MDVTENINLEAITLDRVEDVVLTEAGMQLHMLHMEKIHPIVSGNKWFKLRYYLEAAQQKGFRRLLTFGGPYSNHIVASAFAAKMQQMEIIGVIRGEEPANWSSTLREAKSYGMQLHFVSRTDYDKNKRVDNLKWLREQFGACYVVPEGGVGLLGVKGLADWLQTLPLAEYTHLVAPIGTGTTIAALLRVSAAHQQVMGVSAMKNNIALPGEIESLFNRSLPERFTIFHEYHFGGYGKQNAQLLQWMNDFYGRTGIRLDFVYTAKMVYSIFDLINRQHFSKGAKILALHTGGLQGNTSLPTGALIF